MASDPNFADVSGDLPLDRLRVLVGIHLGEPLRPITLRQYLADCGPA